MEKKLTASSITSVSTAEIDSVLNRVFAWCQKHDFRGYNKHDALNSPLLRALLGWGKWPRIVAIQAIMRSPINIRPLMGIPRTTNPKGLALLVLGLLDRHKASQNADYLLQAKELSRRLLSCRSEVLLPKRNYSGDCWGYPYPWQDPGFHAPTHTPNAVVTCFVCEAFLEMYRQTGDKMYLDPVESATQFFLKDLTILENQPDTLCLGYMPLPMTMRVMDVSILIGAVLAQLAAITSDVEKMKTAKRLVGFVVGKQTEYGAWFYTDPPDASLIRHDNYHTGFILDSLWRYMEASNDWTWQKNYEGGLNFYAENLFNLDGSPRWMSDKDYPHDVHGAAQGLISFAHAIEHGYDYHTLMQKIAVWSLTNLYHRDGRFFYRQTRCGTRKFTLLRWCNAWMFRGWARFETAARLIDPDLLERN
jgi:hypothetical protein